MNQHFLAGCALSGILPAAVLAARERRPAVAVLAAVVALGVTAILANAAADLW